MVKSLPGVNLGGWLVLEKWMTPSVFAGTDATNEYELAQVSGGVRRISQHHINFLAEADFAWLKRAGIKALRVPVGFWVLHGHHPYTSAQKQLDWLFNMAHKYDLQVLLCLHAAPGAQNSNDHSGSGRPGGKPGWYTRFNQHVTRQVLIELAERYGEHSHLWGIELLNEPEASKFWQKWQLWWWSRRTAWVLRNYLPSQVKIVISDAYQPRWWSGKIGTSTLDIHHYQCFSVDDQANTTYSQHRTTLKKAAARYTKYATQQPLIIGEWSATLPKKVQTDTTARQFCQDQNKVLKQAEVWFFWSYKTEHGGTWSFRELYEKGYFSDIL